MSLHLPLAQAQLSYQPGDVIAGKYALEAVLGSGGMGAVFRARNTVIDMPVAIKLIRADLDREQFGGRLLQEARAAAKLGHPAIVRVFDVGQTALGDPFIVMELLEGEPLSELVEREGRLTSARAVQLLLPIADALSTAHAKGFVHRDVKPDNVFISCSAEGRLQPKLVDFGIVKQEERGAEAQTQAGLVMGSPDYMSPEQARGQADVDLRSDVWSFCVVVYEAIIGRPPFEADNYNALMRLIVESEPPTLRELSAADEALSSIIAKGLSKAPSDRWSSFGQLGKALATWLYEQGIGEDACGASLEARWLSRPTDPFAPRVVRSDPPNHWPEPPSRVRTVGKLGFAPTVRSAGTPHSLAQTRVAPPRSSRRIWAVAAGVVGAFLTAGLLLYAALRGSAAPEAVTAAPPLPASAPVAAEPTTPVLAAPSIATAPFVATARSIATAPSVATAPFAAESAARPEPAPAAPHRARKPRAATAATPHAPPLAAPATATSASDLLAPY